jgi:hypothetical protein
LPAPADRGRRPQNGQAAAGGLHHDGGRAGCSAGHARIAVPGQRQRGGHGRSRAWKPRAPPARPAAGPPAHALRQEQSALWSLLAHLPCRCWDSSGFFPGSLCGRETETVAGPARQHAQLPANDPAAPGPLIRGTERAPTEVGRVQRPGVRGRCPYHVAHAGGVLRSCPVLFRLMCMSRQLDGQLATIESIPVYPNTWREVKVLLAPKYRPRKPANHGVSAV